MKTHFRLRRGDHIQLRQGAGRVISVNDCSARVLLVSKVKTVLGDKPVTFKKTRVVHISPNSEATILRRVSNKNAPQVNSGAARPIYENAHVL